MKYTIEETKKAAEELLTEEPQFQGFFDGNANGFKLTMSEDGSQFFIEGSITAFAKIPIHPRFESKKENIKYAIQTMIMTNFFNINNKTSQLSVTCCKPMESLITETGLITPDQKPEKVKVNVFLSQAIPTNAMIIHPMLHDELRNLPSSRLKNTNFLITFPWWEKVTE